MKTLHLKKLIFVQANFLTHTRSQTLSLSLSLFWPIFGSTSQQHNYIPNNNRTIQLNKISYTEFMFEEEKHLSKILFCRFFFIFFFRNEFEG